LLSVAVFFYAEQLFVERIKACSMHFTGINIIAHIMYLKVKIHAMSSVI